MSDRLNVMNSFLALPFLCSLGGAVFADPAMADWANLPQELLLLIAKRLESRFHLKKFRAVCPTWRASAPSNLRPCLALWSPLPWGLKSFLVKRTTCLFKSPGQTTPSFWLASIEEDQFGKKHLGNPLPWRKIRSEVQYPSVLDLEISNHQVQELVSEYSIQKMYNQDPPLLRVAILFNTLAQIVKFHYRVAYLNTDPNDDDDHFTLLLGDVYGRIGHLQLLKSGDEEATTIETTSFFGLDAPRGDFIQFKRKFYVVDYTGTTICIEPNSGSISPVAPAVELLGSPHSNYLIEWCGKLLLVEIVELEFPRPFECRVFWLDEGGKKWVPLGSLGDGILFLGGLRKFFAPAIHGVQGNCIVFVMDNGNGIAYVFDLSKQETVPLVLRPDLHELFIPPSYRGANVFKPDLSLKLGITF